MAEKVISGITLPGDSTVYRFSAAKLDNLEPSAYAKSADVKLTPVYGWKIGNHGEGILLRNPTATYDEALRSWSTSVEGSSDGGVTWDTWSIPADGDPASANYDPDRSKTTLMCVSCNLDRVTPYYKVGSSDVTLLSNDYGAYAKPEGGIPDSDLSAGVKSSLGKADAALAASDVVAPASDADFISAANKDKVPTCRAVGKQLNLKANAVAQNASVTFGDVTVSVIGFVKDTVTWNHYATSLSVTKDGETEEISWEVEAGGISGTDSRGKLVAVGYATEDSLFLSYEGYDQKKVSTTNSVSKFGGQTVSELKTSLFSSDGFRAGISYQVKTVTDGNLKDRTVNVLTVADNMTISAPAATVIGGVTYARDFVVRIEVGATVPTGYSWGFTPEVHSGLSWGSLGQLAANKKYVYRFTDCGGSALLAAREEVS